jgi:two-component system NarL family sensor kinase
MVDLLRIQQGLDSSRPVTQPSRTEIRVGGLGISARTRNALVFFSALFLLSLGGVVTYLTIIRLNDADRWVAHTREVQSALASLEAVIARAGRGRIEYVQSADPSHLDEYENAVKETLQNVALIRQLSIDNSRQQSNCNRLEEVVHRRIELMGQSIDLKKRGQSDLKKENEITRGVVQVAGEMDLLIRQMQGLEEHLLAQRQERSHVLLTQAIILFWAAFGVAVLLLGLHYYLLNYELKARQRAEESLQQLNARFQEIQDAERRRVARELHESVGQYLSSVKMNLESIGKSLPPNPRLAECVAILDKSISETRAMSHLLHPPLLDEVGFASAASWYVEDFSERSGVFVDMRLPENLGRFASAIELALFRVLQESLTNIYRHSESRKAEITLRVIGRGIELRVKDNGKGMAPNILEAFRTKSGRLGVGLAGMRERLRELNGRLEVQSDASGTRILAVLPIA